MGWWTIRSAKWSKQPRGIRGRRGESGQVTEGFGTNGREGLRNSRGESGDLPPLIISVGGTDIYKNFESNVLIAQKSYIPNREYRSKCNDPKWFNNKIRHLVAVKKGIYRRIKGGEVHLRDRFNTLKRN